MRGLIEIFSRDFFTFKSESQTVANDVASEPVPAVVGIAMMGKAYVLVSVFADSITLARES